jgi:ABC-type enterochelin transport system substrate-binding protein
MKTMVTISRYWTKPEILTTITDESISLQISMDDFIKALKTEIESVTWTFTKVTFEKQLDEAINRVIEKVKEESAKVVEGK